MNETDIYTVSNRHNISILILKNNKVEIRVNHI